MVICHLPMSAYTNSVAEVDIFPRSSSTLGEGAGRITAVAICLFGQRQLLVHCGHHLSTFIRLCVDISCKLYSQQLVKWGHARRSHDWQLTSREGCCCRLTGLCCNTIIRLWQCLPLSTRHRAVYEVRNIPNTTRWHSVCYRHDRHNFLYNQAWCIFLLDSQNDLQYKTCLIRAM